jgi:5-methyltetrahydrofolate--homocysteine methyltransferase
MRQPFLEAVRNRILLGDGAMGTQLQQAGLEPGGCGEAWNVEQPDRVKAIQARYRDAGSDLILTNTFGGTRMRLALHGFEEKAYDFNKAAALLAREVMGEDRYVIGDIGPFGGFLEPLGDASSEEVVAAFEEQARAFGDAGVDAIIIETMTALEEIECALDAVRNVTTVPVIVSLAFDKTQAGNRTMMGVSPEKAAESLTKMGVDVMGCNCGTGLTIAEYAEIAAAFRSVTDKPLIIQPNAGLPELVDDKVVYHESPGMMAAGIPALVKAGANILGGCCGTSPEHIRLIRAEIDKLG